MDEGEIASSHPYPSLSKASRRAGPRVMRVGELAMSLTGCNTQESGCCTLALVTGTGPKHARKKFSKLTSSDTFQDQIQGFELTHPNIYPINEMLDCMKGLVIQF